MYCINPLNFFKLILRLFKWAIYIVFGAIALGMLTLAIGNYAHAAEWAPAKEITTNMGICRNEKYQLFMGAEHVSYDVCQQSLLNHFKSRYPTFVWSLCDPHPTEIKVCHTSGGSLTGSFEIRSSVSNYACPPDGKPEFTMGPKVTNNGTVCEKKPLQCLLGSVKDVNAITGKEFCRPICEGIAGNTYGTPQEPVSYFTSNFGSVKIHVQDLKR